jgi:hypothetical protein
VSADGRFLTIDALCHLRLKIGATKPVLLPCDGIHNLCYATLIDPPDTGYRMAPRPPIFSGDLLMSPAQAQALINHLGKHYGLVYRGDGLTIDTY